MWYCIKEIVNISEDYQRFRPFDNHHHYDHHFLDPFFIFMSKINNKIKTNLTKNSQDTHIFCYHHGHRLLNNQFHQSNRHYYCQNTCLNNTSTSFIPISNKLINQIVIILSIVIPVSSEKNKWKKKTDQRLSNFWIR